MRGALVAALVVAAGCGIAPQRRAPGTLPRVAVRMLAQDYRFDPAEVVAQRGSQVHVLNGDPEAHTVTADDGSFDAGPFGRGIDGSFTAPSRRGRYAFHCRNHPQMRGTLVVR